MLLSCGAEAAVLIGFQPASGSHVKIQGRNYGR